MAQGYGELWKQSQRLRIEAQESLAAIDTGYLTRNSRSIFLSFGSRSGQQAVLAGSTSFLLSPPQPRSSSQTSASDLGPCFLTSPVPNCGWQGRGGRSAGVGRGRKGELWGKLLKGFASGAAEGSDFFFCLFNVPMYHQNLTS